MAEITELYPEFPDPRGMTRESLTAYREMVQEWISLLDQEEPDDMDSEDYDAWGDRHEVLEDLLDEIMDLLEA